MTTEAPASTDDVDEQADLYQRLERALDRLHDTRLARNEVALARAIGDVDGDALAQAHGEVLDAERICQSLAAALAAIEAPNQRNQ